MKRFILWLLMAIECHHCGVITTQFGTWATLRADMPTVNRHVCLRCYTEQKGKDVK